jgi:hypothetical protein
MLVWVGRSSSIYIKAIDLLVQIRIRNELRRMTVVANIAKELQDGDICFKQIFRFDGGSGAGGMGQHHPYRWR